MATYQLTREGAHPHAQKLLIHDFYWSPIEETGPMGSDDGSDAIHSFQEWRATNATVSPIIFLDELIAGWGYPAFDRHMMDPVLIEAYINSASTVADEQLDEQLTTMLEAANRNKGANDKIITAEEMRAIMADASKGKGLRYLTGIDNATIAVAFGQFMLEGAVDPQLKGPARSAAQRQVLPVLLNRWHVEYRGVREQQLYMMLQALDAM